MTNVPFAIREFPIASLEIPADHRTNDESVVACLAESIEKIGLRTPPTVRVVSEDPLKAQVVTGVHRIKALR